MKGAANPIVIRAVSLSFIFLVLFVFFTAKSAFPSDEADEADEINITSDSLEQKDSTYFLKGNVVLKRANTFVKADEAVYNTKTSDAELKGNVSYVDDNLSISAEEGRMNLKEETGVLYNAYVFVKKDNYHIRAKELRKTSARGYHLKSATVTTCDAALPAWCLRGKDIDLTIGDRIRATLVSFKVKGVPVLYTPYLWAPVLTDRKTGFLFPTFGYTTAKGFYLRQPFFWVIRENRDATFFLDAYTKRGVGQALEYRYIERADIKGRAYVYHMRDRVLQRDFIELRAEHETGRGGEGAAGFLNINAINRREFLRHYSPYYAVRSGRFLESNFEITRPLRSSRLYLRGEHLIELKDGIGQSQVSQRLPEIGFVLNPVGTEDIKLSLTGAASNFWRREGVEGQRLRVNARGAYTMGQTLTLSHVLSAEEAAYRLATEERGDYTKERLTYTAALQRRFIKTYSRLTHAVTPSASYRHILRTGRKSPYVFDSAELNLPHTQAELSLMNRLRDEEGEFLTMKLAGVLDSDSGKNLTLGLLAGRTHINLRSNVTYDLREEEFVDAVSGLTVNIRKAVFSLSQNYARQGNILQHSIGAGYAYSKALSLDAMLWYDSKGGGVNTITGQIRYERQCWGANLLITQRTGETSVFLTINLKGLGSIKTAPPGG